jgi:L-alanine-DL-glutamate epimerase-like enolase superfamily enzyme
MQITDLRCAIIGDYPVVRITTDEGIDGYGQVESWKPFLKPHVLFYRDYLIGADPTNVEAVMMRIRRMGSFKPWGAAVSAIEMALWDIAGKAAGVPVYKLLGGKVRDKVRVYNGAVRFPMPDQSPESYAENVLKMAESPEKFSIIKQAISFHSPMMYDVPNYYYGEIHRIGRHPNRGLMTEQGFRHTMACIDAMKKALGDRIGLALDCGPGLVASDALRLAKACEDYHLMWLEDMITGDYVPYTQADVYRDITMQTSTPIHTGEQLYLRQHFVELIEKQAVNVIGPDPLDVGGIAELKWIAEYADLHGIMMAPHGTGDGLLGLAALVQVSATLPGNYIAFEYPKATQPWWYDIVDGLPDPIVVDSHIAVWDRPGLGVTFNVPAARKYLTSEDKQFFD